MALSMHILLATGALALAAAQGPGSSAESSTGPPTADTRTALLEELCAEPRVVGTAGYLRALGIIERELTAAGLTVARETTEITRAIPRVSDVLLFEDEIATSAFAGLREHWDHTAVPTMAPPPAYAWNPEVVDARAAIVDCGSGLAADFERVAGLRISLSGAIALVSVPSSPGERQSTVREIAAHAWEAGCVAVLIAPAAGGSIVDDYILEDTTPPAGTARDKRELAVAVVPIRTTEADAIRGRLRVKRVRGADGTGTTLRLGPGPVEAGIRIECPHETLSNVPVLVCDWLVHEGRQSQRQTQRQTQTIRIASDERLQSPLGGAAVVAAALGAATLPANPKLPRPDLATGNKDVGIRLVFAPHGAHFERTDSQSVALDAILALAGPDTNPASGASPFHASSLPALYGESVERLNWRLGGELSARLDAGARSIAYSLLSPGPANANASAAADALRILRAPPPASPSPDAR